MTNYKPVILFDLDGTLIDSTQAIVNGFCKAFIEHKIKEPSKEQICSLIGHPLEYMFGSLGVPNHLISNFIAVYKEDYRQNYLAQTTLLPGAFEAVNIASEFANLGVVTTKTSLYSKILLEHLGILEYFSAVIGRDDVTNPKPNPEPIIKALNLVNESPVNAYMIGDTPMDAKAAKSAGVTSIGVTCGYESKEKLEPICDYVCMNALDAVKLIRVKTDKKQS